MGENKTYSYQMFYRYLPTLICKDLLGTPFLGPRASGPEGLQKLKNHCFSDCTRSRLMGQWVHHPVLNGPRQDAVMRVTDQAVIRLVRQVAGSDSVAAETNSRRTSRLLVMKETPRPVARAKVNSPQ